MMEKLNRDIRLILTDIDGVWTDGGMYYDQQGNELKRFCTYDGGGVFYAHLFGMKVGIVTGEQTGIVESRAKKVKADYCLQGVVNKLEAIDELCNREGYSLSEVAYIGDDVPDLPVLKTEILSACPSNAFDYVKKECDIVLQKEGGQGAFRELVELIINSKYGTNSLPEALRIIEDNR